MLVSLTGLALLAMLWIVVRAAALGVADGLREGLRRYVRVRLDLATDHVVRRGVGYEVVRALVDNRRDGVRIPDVVVEARWLTPWSAEFRYDDPPVPDELDRNASLRSAEQTLAWARGVLADRE